MNPSDALARKITERPARAPVCDHRLDGNNGGIVLRYLAVDLLIDANRPQFARADRHHPLHPLPRTELCSVTWTARSGVIVSPLQPMRRIVIFFGP